MTIEPTEYKTATTKSKQRINSFSGSNELGQTPAIVFNEELVTHDSVANLTIKTPVGSCVATLDDPAKILTLRNPVDDTIIGAATYQDVFVLLYSLGRQTQNERDEYVG